MEINREEQVSVKRVVKKRKRRSTDDDDDLPKRWSDLSNDLLESIKKRLFYIDQCNLSAVCKSWSSIEEEEEIMLVPPLQQMPWLLVLDNTDSYKLVDPKYKKTYTVNVKSIKEKMNINSFDRIQCHESKYGWLLISSMDQNPDSTTRLFLYSPFLDENKNCFELPILSFGICMATFTSNPLDDEDCTVVTLNTSFQVDAIVIHTYHLGHCSWTSLIFTCDQFSLSDVKRWIYNTDEGMFYYVLRDGRVGTFDLAREEWKVFPPLPTTMQTRLQTLFGNAHDVKVYMVKSGGELFLVSERNLSRKRLLGSHWFCDLQHIFKLDLSSMIWEDLKSVGERVLFIGDGYSSVLNSSVLKSNGEWTKVSDTIYYCSHLQLFYCTVHDYTATYGQYPRRYHCERHYGWICREDFGKMLVDPPPLHH